MNDVLAYAMEIEAKFAAVVASARGRTTLADAEGASNGSLKSSLSRCAIYGTKARRLAFPGLKLR